MTGYSIEPRIGNMSKDMEFYHLQEIFLTNIEKIFLNTGQDALKTAYKKVVHIAAEATGECIGNEIADKIVKAKHVLDENPRNVEEIIILPEKEKKYETN